MCILTSLKHCPNIQARKSIFSFTIEKKQLIAKNVIFFSLRLRYRNDYLFGMYITLQERQREMERNIK